MTEQGGRGDPRRTLELLWGKRDVPNRGPKGKLDVPKVVRTAVELADADGLAALSMRKVADRLGVSPMSLYTYVPGKAELLDLMFDAVQVEIRRPESPEGGWREQLAVFAEQCWQLYRRHVWLLQLAIGRPILGPHIEARYDYCLTVIDGIGLTDVEMDSVCTLIDSYVGGAARMAVDSAQAERESGLTDAQWWEQVAPVLAEVSDPARNPVAARVGTAAGETHEAAYVPDYAFRFGLERILDSVELLVSGR